LISIAIGAWAVGAAPSAAQSGDISPVAIIDLGYIYKNHERFKALSEDLAADVKAAEEALNEEKESLRALYDQIEQYDQGTEERRQLEEEYTKRDADVRVRVTIQKKEFIEREAQLYYNVYQEIVDRVETYCDRNGVMLVLRFNGDPITATSPDDILRGLNSMVVYYASRIDITPIILDELNQSNPRPDDRRRPQGASKGKQGVPQR
jgi:Skp family chaperone for outer membrane proteins